MIIKRNFDLKKGIIVIVMLLFTVWNTSAQQDPMFTQYMHNPVSINPAYAGSRGTLNFVAMHRQQWVGMDGAPKTLTISVNSPFIGYNVGIGLSLIHDEIGPVKQTGLYADYSYHLKITPKTKLSFGLKGGVNMYDVNLLNLIGAQNDDHLILYGVRKLYLPNFGLGSYLYSDRFYLGFSIPKMLQNSLSDDQNTLNYANKEERHIFISGGFVIDIAENIKFKPSTSMRMVSGAPLSAEFSAAFLLHDRLWLGGMYRFGDSFGGLVKFDLTSQLSVGYSYDTTQSGLRAYNQGTHEVLISYDVTFKNKKILSPRYF
ncbi:MAG: type IX secretion system membrane protein PorP/SprF [Bacteroidota bacterium]|nr:type IX secretion system membrane protein PorP/SprF [Bacteroidota bacterium]